MHAMHAASSVVRQVVAQQALGGAPAVVRLASVLGSRIGQQPSWQHATGVAQLSASAKPEEAPQAEPQASSSGASAGGDAAGGGAAGAEQPSGSGTGAAEGASSSGGGGGAFGGFADTFGSFRQRLGGGGGGAGDEQEGLQQRAQRLWGVVKKEVADAVLPRQERVSLTRVYDGPVYQPGDGPASGATALATVQQPRGRASRLVDELHERFGHHPLFARLRRAADAKHNPVLRRGAELADDLRDKYETSDHPAVHKVEDVKEKLFGMSETAAAMALIRSRDPGFDMSRLLEGVRCDAPVVVKAFLTHDLDTLGKHCGPELLERLAGIFRHFEAQGLYEDPTILFVGEPELVEVKLVEGEPLVVVQFACQQLKCTRDKFGNVVDGDPNSIQRVFYFWGLQQEHAGAVLPDGRVLPPRWVLKDQMWQAVLALV